VRRQLLSVYVQFLSTFIEPKVAGKSNAMGEIAPLKLLTYMSSFKKLGIVVVDEGGDFTPKFTY